MSYVAIIGMLLAGLMSQPAVCETIITPEECAHNMDPEYDMANRDMYNDIEMFDLYMDAVIAADNHCETCGDMYYKHCSCEVRPVFEPKCECGDEYHEIDYLVFVNDYVNYMDACNNYCDLCDQYYYSHCCEEPLCDFGAYLEDVYYLELHYMVEL